MLSVKSSNKTTLSENPFGNRENDRPNQKKPIAIYVACHKTYPRLADDPIYIPLQVGKGVSSQKLEMAGDDTGENISEKNASYSELTGLYWIWKNTSSPIVGLCHYRRFFFSKEPDLLMKLKKRREHLLGLGKQRFGIYYTTNFNKKNLILTEKEIDELLETFDIIIPVEKKIKRTVWAQYGRRHVLKDLEMVRTIISEKHPGFLSSFDEAMQKKEMSAYNMFIMKRPHFDAYMTWLFDILFELEKRIDVSSYDNYQKRVFGFLSERLMAVWLKKTSLKTKKLPVLYFHN